MSLKREIRSRAGVNLTRYVPFEQVILVSY